MLVFTIGFILGLIVGGVVTLLMIAFAMGDDT